MRPSISVVVPCHNYGHYLAETLESVRAQSQPPAEIILVDDGSTDGSADIARRVLPGIIVIAQPKSSIGGARNTGLRAATGDLVALLDADDLWPADSLALRVAAIEADPGVAGSFGQIEHFLCPTLDDETRARLVCPEGRSAARFAGSLLVRRDAMARVGPFDTDLVVGEMIEWLARFNALGLTLAEVDALVLRRRIHRSNTVRGQQANFRGYLAAMRSAARHRAATAAE